jgi:hypothetical protein
MTRKIKQRKEDSGKNIKASQNSSDISPDLLPPIFSLKIDKNYCITNCTQEEKAQFALTLHQLSQLSWRQIRQADKHGVGYEKIARSSIKCGIPDNVTEDVSIIAFRFYGKAPMVGYRDAINRRIFHIIWLDRSFCLYNHGS